jgi:hypothetical protein
VSLSLLERPNEAILLFGGLTMIFLLPLAMLVSAEWVFGLLSILIWLFALVVPIVFDRRSTHTRIHLELFFVLQLLFSAVQAGLGFLVILGKQC